MKVSLFIPCLVDRFFPQIGLDTAHMLELAGHEVLYDPRQTCCGQPAFNSGDLKDAVCLARRFLKIFGEAEAVVAPSGSCVSMVANHFEELPLTPSEMLVWEHLRHRVFELAQFLDATHTLGRLRVKNPRRVALHHSCHYLRELHGATDSLGRLLAQVEGLEIVPATPEQCCGFGGTFSFKFQGVSLSMAEDKVRAFQATGADTLILADAGCLMNIQGVIQAQGLGDRLKVQHYSALFFPEADGPLPGGRGSEVTNE
jgi:L-lactate dehydrogenase complex protein LldE